MKNCWNLNFMLANCLQFFRFNRKLLLNSKYICANSIYITYSVPLCYVDTVWFFNVIIKSAVVLIFY